MRRLLISTFMSLACVIPALAQDAPRAQSSTPNAAQDKDLDEAPSATVESLQQSLQTRLALAGFTDIQMTPSSFLVLAKDPDGKPVMLMLSPDSVTELQVAPGQGLQDDDTGNDTSSDRPSTNGPSANDEE